MNRFLLAMALAGAAGLGALAMVAAGACNPRVPPDVPRPEARTAAPANGPLVTAADFSKTIVIEPATKAVVARASAPAPTTAGSFVNPRVPPGQVNWHPTLAAARKAAQKSGRPVLLFQMMGKLDEQFC
jgi:hypothetical protein